MPIVRTLSATYFAPVALAFLNADGAIETLQFDAQFKRLKTSEMDALLAAPREARQTDVQVLDEQMVGWRGLENEGGTAIAYSPEARNELNEQYIGLNAAIATARWDSLRPTQAAYHAAKN